MIGVKARRGLFYSPASCWYGVKKLTDLSQASGWGRKHSFHCPWGHSCFYHPFAVPSSTPSPPGNPGKPKLTLCSSSWSSVITPAICPVLPDTPGLHFPRQLSCFCYLPPTTCPFQLLRADPRASTFPQRAENKAASRWLSLSSSWYSSPWAVPAAFPYMIFKAPSRKTESLVEPPSEWGWQPSQGPHFPGGCSDRDHLPPWCLCFSCTAPWEEGFASSVKRSAAKPGVGTFSGCASTPTISCWPALGNTRSHSIALQRHQGLQQAERDCLLI